MDTTHTYIRTCNRIHIYAHVQNIYSLTHIYIHTCNAIHTYAHILNTHTHAHTTHSYKDMQYITYICTCIEYILSHTQIHIYIFNTIHSTYAHIYKTHKQHIQTHMQYNKCICTCIEHILTHTLNTYIHAYTHTYNTIHTYAHTHIYNTTHTYTDVIQYNDTCICTCIELILTHASNTQIHAYCNRSSKNRIRGICTLKYETQKSATRQTRYTAVHRDLRGNPQTGKTTGEQFLHYQNSGNTEQKITAANQGSSCHTTMARSKLLSLSLYTHDRSQYHSTTVHYQSHTQKFALVTYILM